jgi:hypothetical protein
MSSLLADLRHALRLLARSPGFSAAVVATLALGIGANTAIFSVVRAVVLRPLPYADSGRLVWGAGSMVDLKEVIAAVPAIGEAAITASNRYDLPADEGGDAEQIRGDVVRPSFFRVLGVAPALGRVFADDDDQTPLAVLGDHLWRTRYHGDPRVAGKSIVIGGRQHTIIGVMPPGFRLPSTETALWVTLGSAISSSPKQSHDRSLRVFKIIARLAPGAASSPTSSRSARRRSASASRSARSVATCCSSSSTMA